MNFALMLLLIAAFFNGLAWVLLIPLWQYPDEQAHFSQVQNMAEFGYVPSGNNTSSEIIESEIALATHRDNVGNNAYTYNPEFKLPLNEFYYLDSLTSTDKKDRIDLVAAESTNNPPLYYTFAAAVYKTLDRSDLFSRVYAIRLLSVGFYVLNMLVAYKIGELIFKKDNFLKLTFAILVTFTPMLVFASTGVLPDSLTNLLFSSLVYINVKILLEGFKQKYLLGLVSFTLLGLVTRQHFLISLAISSLAIFYQVSKKSKQLIFFLVSLFFLAVLIIVLNYFGTSLPLISNIRIPDFDIFNSKYLSVQQFIDHFLWTLNHTYREVLPWYWGVYKWLSLTMPHTTYQVINRLILLSALGILVRLVVVFRSKKISQTDKVLFFMILSSLIYFMFFLIWDYFFRSKNVFSFGVQGRYFFPIITAHFTIMLIGFWQIFFLISRKFYRHAISAVAVLMILFNDYSLAFVASSYYNTSSLNTFLKQATLYKPSFIGPNVIMLVLAIAMLTQLILLAHYYTMVRKNFVDIMGQ